MRTFRLDYAGSTPGADSNAYTIVDSTNQSWATTGVVEDAVNIGDVNFYELTLKNSAVGTLRGYASSDAGATWNQFFERYVPPSTTRRTNDYSVRIDGHKDFKFVWTNGGSAQSTWYVGQALSVEPSVDDGVDAFDYVTAGDMSADISCPALAVGANGELTAMIQWAATGTAIGTITLEGSFNGSTWKTIPGASTEFTTQPSNNTGDLVCQWKGLQFSRVRLKYTRASGGTANTSFAVQARTR